MLRKFNLDGDKQADLKVHGGMDKAIYAYPSEHYEYWLHELPSTTTLPYGMFGENLTTERLMEDQVNIGDQFEIGNRSAKVIVTQPRMPCYKLGVKFGRMDIVKMFLASCRPGVYFRVLQEGEIEPTDEMRLVKRDKNNVTVKDIIRSYMDDKPDVETIQRALKIKVLPEGLRHHFLQRLDQLAH